MNQIFGLWMTSCQQLYLSRKVVLSKVKAQKVDHGSIFMYRFCLWKSSSVEKLISYILKVP